MIKDGFDDPIGIIKFITINGVPTKIVIYDSNPNEIPFDYDRLILMISGKFSNVVCSKLIAFIIIFIY